MAYPPPKNNPTRRRLARILKTSPPTAHGASTGHSGVAASVRSGPAEHEIRSGGAFFHFLRAGISPKKVSTLGDRGFRVFQPLGLEAAAALSFKGIANRQKRPAKFCGCVFWLPQRSIAHLS
jgi:hypothetical protein